MWLLDTNAWIRYLNSADSGIERRLVRHPRTEIFLCDVVKSELYYGAFHSQRVGANLAILENLFSAFVSFPFDGPAARIAGQIRSQLSNVGTPIGPYDLQIAAIALARDLILVTHNTREFSRIPSLQIEDWES